VVPEALPEITGGLHLLPGGTSVAETLMVEMNLIDLVDRAMATDGEETDFAMTGVVGGIEIGIVTVIEMSETGFLGIETTEIAIEETWTGIEVGTGVEVGTGIEALTLPETRISANGIKIGNRNHPGEQAESGTEIDNG
jgi:hypothetical protein